MNSDKSISSVDFSALVKNVGSEQILNDIIARADAAPTLARILPDVYPPAEVASSPDDHAWTWIGTHFLSERRYADALTIFWGLYYQMLAAQRELGRVHKGTPLVWVSECYEQLDYPVHAKRLLMLSMCEDAITQKGEVPHSTGSYWRLLFRHSLSASEINRYALKFSKTSQELPKESLYPEAMLQRVDDNWITELPSAREALTYRINQLYVQHLLGVLDDKTGQTLEILSQYLLSCMPGCRALRRRRTPSSDLDIVCAMEGPEVDFRSELGRYFVCECKDLTEPAAFTDFAKFCRVLDSTKSRFGILFSKSGISGTGRTTNAEREQLKVFQDRGIVIVVVDKSDLERIASGENFINVLRTKYETVRLDLKVSVRSISGP